MAEKIEFHGGKIEPRSITDEVRQSYLDYAMSVIVARALPDVRDGLKPVHRRILYSMWSTGLRSTAKFRKSATVVGEVLGKYHPHGDTAVYDTMVRLAQDFSLRYPLVWGQGNFGCFTKDTEVQLADGRKLSFAELIQEDKAGKTNYTFTINNEGRVAIAKIRKPRLTKKKAEIMKVVLDNGNKIKCTLNHKFLLKDGTYVEAQDLQAGTSLMPLYTRPSSKDDTAIPEMLGYEMIFNPKDQTWVFAHHLSDAYNIQNKRYAKKEGRVRHHVDFNKLNNSPENIQRMHWQDHWRLHSAMAAERHSHDPGYVQKLAAGRKIFWDDPKNKKKYSDRMSERNQANWEKPEYREKMRETLSMVNKQFIADHPEKREEISKRATKTLKRLWQIPEYREAMHQKIIKGNKNHTTNRTGLLKFNAVCQYILNHGWPFSEENYEKARKVLYPYGAATLWETGLKKYYSNDIRKALAEISGNHKVKRIVFHKERADVYDLTIGETHNFALAAGVFVHNSMDGDSAAAYRYTEAKLKAIAEEMLLDIDKDTVDFSPNFDGMHEEPQVLPAKLPQLLLNGTMGIAVGMATNIPPHNLNELVDGIAHLIDHPEATIEDLMEFIKGPDFPTGGILYNVKDVRAAYATGKGPILTRAKAEIIEGKTGQFQIVITEMTYATNKAALIMKIADLVKEDKIQGIRDLRDESDKDGVRVVVDLKKDAYPQKVLNSLYSMTDLQKNFNVNMLALVDGVDPQILTLKAILEHYIRHREQVVTRRATFELQKAKDRAHILEGLSIALDHIDEVIAVIKKSETREVAHANLMKKFKLSELQATAILEMRLQTLAGLERKKIEDELAEKRKLIAELEDLLKSRKKILGLVKSELQELKEKYGDERRTRVIKSGLSEFSQEDLIPNDEAIMTLTADGYIKRMNPGVYRVQKRGGKGVMGATTKEEDRIAKVLSMETHDDLMFFTNTGKVFQTKAYEIPESTRTARGQAIVNFLQLSQEEKITAVIATNKKDAYQYLFMATVKGTIKKTKIAELEKVRRSGLIAINLEKGDTLAWVSPTTGSDDVVLTTNDGQAIRFRETDVRPMGRNAAGVRGMKLKNEDKLVGMDIVPKGEKDRELLILSQNGFGKRSNLDSYKVQKRGGSGIKTMKVTPKTGKLVGALVASPENTEDDLILTSEKGIIIRVPLSSVPRLSRVTQGVRVMKPQPGDRVCAVTLL